MGRRTSFKLGSGYTHCATWTRKPWLWNIQNVEKGPRRHGDAHGWSGPNIFEHYQFHARVSKTVKHVKCTTKSCTREIHLWIYIYSINCSLSLLICVRCDSANSSSVAFCLRKFKMSRDILLRLGLKLARNVGLRCQKRMLSANRDRSWVRDLECYYPFSTWPARLPAP